VSKKVPYIAQMEAVECGAASLGMVLAYWGHHAPLADLRQACGVSRDGSTAKNILAGARSYGLVAKARRAEPEDLASCTHPAILHWRFEHFVVLERWSKERTVLVDPGQGRRLVSPAELDESFTGICLEFEPGADFVERPAEKRTLARYGELLRGSRHALAIVVIAALALNVLALALPLATQVVIDHVLGAHHPGWLSLVAGCAAALIAMTAFYTLSRDLLLRRLRRHLDQSIGVRFVRHLLGLPVVFFHQRSAADLLMRVGGNQTIRELLTGSTIALLVDGVMLVAYLALMMMFDVTLGLVVAGAGVLHVATYLVSRRWLAVAVEDYQRKEVVATGALLGTLSGIATVKAAGIEDKSHARWLDATIHAVNAQSRFSLLQQTVTTVLGAIRLVVPVAIVAIGGYRVLAGELSAGTLVSFQMLQAGFLGPLESTLQMLLRLEIVPVLFDRMDDVLQTQPEPNGAETSPRLLGDIELEHVSFSYGPRSPLVLEDISIKIARGSKVAMVGASGCGKSTLARLILGLYEPTSGTVRLDGRDLATLDRASVRRQYGVVMQEAFVIDGSIADNIRLYHPSLSIDEVIGAARVAQLHDDIIALPNGYDTVVSSHGGPLSGGQRQRLALARAVAHRPPIMILDEATSALDAPTEAAIERYLSTRSCTRIVIAHRLNTVRNADLICVLADGKIAEMGTHDELAARDGHYATLIASEAATKPDSVAPDAAEVVSPGALDAFEALAQLTPSERTRLTAMLDAGTFEPGHVLLHQDEIAPGLHLIAEGTVEVKLSEPGLDTWTVTELGAGELVGELSLLDGSPSSASVVAKTAVRTFFVPQTRFWQLLDSGDSLGASCLKLLGGLVARRAHEALAPESEHAAGRLPRELAEASARARTVVRSAPARLLADTLIGASLLAQEVATLEEWGVVRRLSSGEHAFDAGKAADRLFVILGGRMSLCGPGEIRLGQPLAAGEDLAPWAVFDVATQPVAAIAEADCQLFSVSREILLEQFERGHPVARKVLSHLSREVVRVLRMVNFRLRERVALERGELERAHNAREAARASALADREALQHVDPTRIPHVATSDPTKTHAACLSAILRQAGRPAHLAGVVEAMASARRGRDVVVHGAKAFGWTARRLELLPGEMEKTQRAIVVETKEWNAVVVEPKRHGRFRVMDPLAGVALRTPAELREIVSTSGYELEAKPAVRGASFKRRLRTFAHGERKLLGQVLVFTIALELVTLGASIAVALVVGAVLPAADGGLLRSVIVGSAALAVSIAVFGALQGRAIEYLRVHFDRDMVNQMMGHVLKLPIGFFERRESGDVLRRFRAFDEVRRLFSTQGVSALFSLVSFVMAAALLLALDVSFGAIAIFELVLYAAVVRILFPRLRAAAAAEREARSREQSRLLELFSGVATFRMAGDRSAAVDRWRPSFLAAIAHGASQDSLRTTATALLDVARSLAFLAALVIGASRVIDRSGSMTALVAGLGILGSFAVSLHALAEQLLNSAPSAVDFETVDETFAEAVEQRDPNPLSPGELRGGIVLDRVSFRYDADGPLTLDDVSLTIEPGTKVALVGRSGSGKSTLGKLLLGMYLPTGGRILFDGKDLSNLDLQAVRGQIGVVLQQPHLMAGSVRENIALAADGASYDDVVAAARKAPDGVPDGGDGGRRHVLGRPAPALRDRARAPVVARDSPPRRSYERARQPEPARDRGSPDTLDVDEDRDRASLEHRARR
jgi:ATP-binding cassette subfamily B protein